MALDPEDYGAGSTQARMEQLGRQRPAKFSNLWKEIGFCFSLLASMLMAEYFVSGFNVILPVLATDLHIPEQSRTWPANVFSLITGAFLLPFGRLAEIYGGYIVFVLSLIWFCVWSLIAGFSRNYVMLVVCRALQGLGAAGFLPAGIMLIGLIYRPGPRKNLVFSLYGAFSPLGFFSGIFFGGLSGEYLPWAWYFWIGSILLAIISVVAFFTVPPDRNERIGQGIRMDWLGTATIAPGLLLLVFAITDSSHASDGWRTPYIYVTFLFGLLFLGSAMYVEGWVVTTPLLPFDVFHVKYMKPLSLALFFSYGVFGLYLFYASFYIQNILHASSLKTTAWFAPMAAGGLLLTTVGGLFLHLLPGTVLLVIGGIGNLACVLLFAIMPTKPNYWAYIFPAMIGATCGVDITFSVSNVFITTALPSKRQGVAGALINSLLFLGISIFLGVADIVATATSHLGQKQSYKAACWLGVGLAGASVILLTVFVKIDKAISDLTADEKAESQVQLILTPLNPTLGAPQPAIGFGANKTD